MSAQSGVLRICEPGNVPMDKQKLDPSDPRVRKLVYSMYRGMLTKRNDEANDFLSQKNPEQVKQDLGVGPILEAIIRQGSSGSGGSGSTPTTPAATANASTTAPMGGGAPPPPPPPMLSAGSLPSVRLNSEVGPLQNKGPPMAIQGAMMKDKKPFTYTPGGIDLSEIRSPRMAKRIQMNAAAEGVTSVPSHPGPPSPQHPPHFLPPAALAAMQPQMPISVFPQGGFNPSSLHRTSKPTDFAPEQDSHYQNQFPPPPPPPQRFSVPEETSPGIRHVSYPAQQRQPAHQQQYQPEQRPQATPQQQYQAEQRQPTQQQQYQQEPRQQNQQDQEHQEFRPPSTTNMNTPKPLASVLNQTIRAVPQPQTKAQTVSQNIGSIYIPPLEQKLEQSKMQAQAPSADSGRRNSFETETAAAERSSSSTPQTPQLNKAPVPWMNSHNRIQNQPSPPYVGSAATPWGTLNSGPGRTIPISIAREDRDEEVDNSPRPVQQQRQPQNVGNRGPPFHTQITNNVGGNPTSNGGRTIQIQMEGNIQRIPPISGQSSPQTPQSAGVSTPARRVGPAPYNSPMSMYSPQAAQEAFKQMQSADLQSGINQMSINDEFPRQEPIQSKSFRVIQKISDDESQRPQQQRKLELCEEDKRTMDAIKARVDEGLTHGTDEPRFRGSTIPSRAFRTLQNNLPPNTDAQEQTSSSSRPSAGNPVTHTIKIKMPESPADEQVQRIPASQQKVEEPKKYMGGNIPSRSFKMLQAMTGESDHTNALGSESDVGPDQMNVNSSSLESPYDLGPSYPSYSESLADPYHENESNNNSNNLCVPPEQYQQCPENFEQNYDWESWDAYTYWYYWWYYNYYNANENKDCPEGWENYSSCEENESSVPQKTVSIPSKSFRNLQKSVDDKFISNRITNELPSATNVPKIVIEADSTNGADTIDVGNKKVYCDRVAGLKIGSANGMKGDWKVINKKDTRSFETEGYSSKNEETEDESACEGDSYYSSSACENEGFVVDEPETPSEDDASTLTDESQPVMIEECFSEPESPLLSHLQNRLSTIEELSENELSVSLKPNLKNFSTNILMSEEDENESSSESSSSEEDNSSASVIENKSGECVASTDDKGKSNDNDSTSSNDEDIEDDEDKYIEQSTVTARLPLKLSFSKSKSYRDIATVLIGDSEIETDEQPASSIKNSVGKKEEMSEPSEDSDSSSSLESNIPVVSYTITISRSDSKNKETEDETGDNVNSRIESEIEMQSSVVGPASPKKLSPESEGTLQNEDDDDGVDFWGEIIRKSSTSGGLTPRTELTEDTEHEVKKSNPDENSEDNSSVDFWQEIESIKRREVAEAKSTEVNFWEKQEIRTSQFNFIESHRNFELTEDYHREMAKTAPLLLTNDPVLPAETIEESVLNGTQGEPIIFDIPANMIVESNKSEQNDDGECFRNGIGEIEIEKSRDTEDCKRTDQPSSEDEERNSPIKNSKAPNGFRSLESPASLSVSDETSDESSSKSSGTTIGKPEKVVQESNGFDKTESKDYDQIKPRNNDGLQKSQTTEKCHTEIIHGIRRTESLDSHCKHDKTDRISKAESLLWRIEKFLQESLCLGSEDDSGFMTDRSRPISECETDYDAEIEVAAGAKKKNEQKRTCTICTETKVSETKVSTAKIVETVTMADEEKVTLRKPTATGRKALNYQRAKTHSRLFQLLQEECGREEDEDEIEIEKPLQSSLEFLEKVVTIETDASPEEESKLSKNRLMTPLPIKTNFPTLDSNSTSSPSGSSGVLSPTSPAHRDQLLADIINEFHLRVNTDLAQKTSVKRNSNFPSKIFKLLQEEFGEEFYDTFHSGDDFLQLSLPGALNGQRFQQNTNSSESNVQENTLHKRESVTKAENQSHLCHTKKFTKTNTSVQKNITANF